MSNTSDYFFFLFKKSRNELMNKSANDVFVRYDPWQFGIAVRTLHWNLYNKKVTFIF